MSALCLTTACPNATARYHYCKPTGRCLDNSLICNSRRDCPDDSDEVNCSQSSANFSQYILVIVFFGSLLISAFSHRINITIQLW